MTRRGIILPISLVKTTSISLEDCARGPYPPALEGCGRGPIDSQHLMDLGGGVGFFGTLLPIGMLAGWIAEKVTRGEHGLIADLIIGVLGAYIGGFLANALGLRLGEVFHGWFWGNLLVSVVGAVILILAYRLVMGRRA